MLLVIFKLCDATFSPKFAWCRHVLPLFPGSAQLFVTWGEPGNEASGAACCNKRLIFNLCLASTESYQMNIF